MSFESNTRNKKQELKYLTKFKLKNELVKILH